MSLLRLRFFFFRHSRFPRSLYTRMETISVDGRSSLNQLVILFNTRIELLENTSIRFAIEHRYLEKWFAFKGKNYIIEMLNLSFFRDGGHIMEKRDKS